MFLSAVLAGLAAPAGAGYQYRSVVQGLVTAPVPVAQSPAPVQLSLSAMALPEVSVGVAYSYDLSALLSNGDPKWSKQGVTWEVVSSSLPAGLSVSAQGLLSGTVSAEGSGSVTVKASYEGVSVTQTYQVASYLTSFRLTACSVTSFNDRFGPTASECQADYASYGAFSNPAVFSIGTGAKDKGFQYWTVPVSGDYVVTLAGAQGGTGNAYSVTQRGGYGATVKTTLTLQKGTVLTFVVGKQPLGASGKSAGGGGGSFVFQGSTVLLAAGGGGGGATTAGEDSSLLAAGTSTAGGSPNGTFGAGGGGISSNGTSVAGASGGLSFGNGFTGGVTLNGTYGGGQGRGGFGGGGGACACNTGNGGNGGGYGGGSGNPFPQASYGYGGGAAGTSYLGGVGQFVGANSGSGWVTISKK